MIIQWAMAIENYIENSKLNEAPLKLTTRVAKAHPRTNCQDQYYLDITTLKIWMREFFQKYHQQRKSYIALLSQFWLLMFRTMSRTTTQFVGLYWYVMQSIWSQYFCTSSYHLSEKYSSWSFQEPCCQHTYYRARWLLPTPKIDVRIYC